MLVLATTALVIPAIFLITAGDSHYQDVGTLSVLVSLLMIAAYIANLFFTLHTHKHLYKNEEADEKAIAPKWSVTKATLILFASTVFVAVLSEILVGVVRPVVAEFGWTELFIGVIVVAIVGNVAEHLSAITAAMKNKMDLSIAIAIGSATQIVMFVAPVLVLVSYMFGEPMNLVFNTFELVAIVFSALACVTNKSAQVNVEGMVILITAPAATDAGNNAKQAKAAAIREKINSFFELLVFMVFYGSRLLKIGYDYAFLCSS
jgi:Ca2+:H+ antiporter